MGLGAMAEGKFAVRASRSVIEVRSRGAQKVKGRIRLLVIYYRRSSFLPSAP